MCGLMGDDYQPYRVRQGDVITQDHPALFVAPTPDRGADQLLAR